MKRHFNAKYSIGCYIGLILISDEIPSNHHDVVLYGLYSDYLQHNNSGLIDEMKTCDLKHISHVKIKSMNLLGYSKLRLFIQKQNNCNEIKLNILFKNPTYFWVFLFK